MRVWSSTGRQLVFDPVFYPIRSDLTELQQLILMLIWQTNNSYTWKVCSGDALQDQKCMINHWWASFMVQSQYYTIISVHCHQLYLCLRETNHFWSKACKIKCVRIHRILVLFKSVLYISFSIIYCMFYLCCSSVWVN